MKKYVDFLKNKKFICLSLVLILLAAVYLLYPKKTVSPAGVEPIVVAESKPAETAPPPAVEKPDIGEWGISIPGIGVWAPIIPDVDEGNQAQYLKAIESGVALSKALAKNPTENGSMFIFGHSEYYKDKPGNYKEVFKELNKIKKGDRFIVFYKRTNYNYEVLESKVVAADDFSIKDATPDNPNDKTITLMTCWPPGTTTNRWIIFAKQI